MSNKIRLIIVSIPSVEAWPGPRPRAKTVPTLSPLGLIRWEVRLGGSVEASGRLVGPEGGVGDYRVFVSIEITEVVAAVGIAEVIAVVVVGVVEVVAVVEAIAVVIVVAVSIVVVLVAVFVFAFGV